VLLVRELHPPQDWQHFPPTAGRSGGTPDLFFLNGWPIDSDGWAVRAASLQRSLPLFWAMLLENSQSAGV
jgi:hypothetical protein